MSAMKSFLLPCCLVFLTLHAPSVSLGADALAFAGGRWLDLSHDFSSETLYWSTAANFVLEEEFHGHTTNGYFYAANRYRASEHGGTHIDAPVDFAENHKTVDQLSIDRLTGPAVVVDVSTKAQKDPDCYRRVCDRPADEDQRRQRRPTAHCGMAARKQVMDCGPFTWSLQSCPL